MVRQLSRTITRTKHNPIIELPDQTVGEFSIESLVIEKNKRISMLAGYSVTFPFDITITMLKQNGQVWMSNSPSEINDTKKLAAAATGHVLIAGLGLGILPALLESKKCVHSITIVEKSQQVIELVSPHLKSSKVRVIVQADFRNWIGQNDLSCYDSFILDIWGDISSDLLPDMFSLIEKLPKSKPFRLWGIDHILKNVLDSARGWDWANSLRNLHLNKLADWLEDEGAMIDPYYLGIEEGEEEYEEYEDRYDLEDAFIDGVFEVYGIRI